jgi:hypothetical protein
VHFGTLGEKIDAGGNLMFQGLEFTLPDLSPTHPPQRAGTCNSEQQHLTKKAEYGNL